LCMRMAAPRPDTPEPITAQVLLFSVIIIQLAGKIK
jgi:hypothetical protein